jgi:hypothetical protein
MSKYRKINNNKGIAIQEPFAPTIKLIAHLLVTQ